MNNRSIIEAANAEWNKALNSGNVKELAALYTENATLSRKWSDSSRSC